VNALRWRYEVFLVRTALLVQEIGPFEPSPDLHYFLADRYLRLAQYHRAQGRVSRASRLVAKAHMHWEALDPDEPPPAMAAVMPIPLPPIFTWAVAKHRGSHQPRKAA